ncbi:nuclear transport factor 2 family protein [Kibdelosporangium aridum]|uniref:Nuclear transport factor 2 family protein n=1 Tax=Kibdelosporangium aridum TaxID=2030 RepID=A0A428ZDM9_KIBAR|nr:nuclear transport factor 2 family protein [Kibdelosporangium aridum]RSM86080.1 nuclear transport factor 2 family protein [Kibdelosporangium aridum]
MDWIEIVDALYRFGRGQDMRDKELFASAFATDATLDFQPAAAKWGGVSPLMTGRDTIVDTIFTVLSDVDTTHVVTNPRVRIDGDTAQLTAIVEAQHLRSGDHSVYALLKNHYEVELVRDGSRWVARRIVIDNAWYQGTPTAFFG